MHIPRTATIGRFDELFVARDLVLESDAALPGWEQTAQEAARPHVTGYTQRTRVSHALYSCWCPSMMLIPLGTKGLLRPPYFSTRKRQLDPKLDRQPPAQKGTR